VENRGGAGGTVLSHRNQHCGLSGGRLAEFVGCACVNRYMCPLEYACFQACVRTCNYDWNMCVGARDVRILAQLVHDT